MESLPPDDYAVLCEEIRELLDAPDAAPDPSLNQLENTLTEGYARALALEAERWRLERKIGELGADVRRGAEQSGDEIADLAARLSQASSRLSRLRALLAALRRRANAVRTGELASFG